MPHIPPELIGALQRYAVGHIETGGFLRSVLENDLVGACRHADPLNRLRLADIVDYLHAQVPAECWGSPEKVVAWIADGACDIPF